MDPKCIYSASDFWVFIDNFKMDPSFDVNKKKTTIYSVVYFMICNQSTSIYSLD